MTKKKLPFTKELIPFGMCIVIWQVLLFTEFNISQTMKTEEHVNKVVDHCRETLAKENLQPTDEESVLEVIRINLSLLENSTERKAFMREVINNVHDLVLIKKYKLLYRQVVHEDEGQNHFNSKSLMKRINQTFYQLS